MKFKLFLVSFAFGLLSIFGTACTPASETSATDVMESESDSEMEMDDQDDHMEGEMDHDAESASSGHMGMDHEHIPPPEEYASFENPFTDDHEALEAGKVIFDTNCATCHGEKGLGDGPAAEALDPKPATLADGMMMSDLSDGYLFWRVTLGGNMDPFNSAMPAWEAVLTEDQRWEVITYVRSLADDSVSHMDDMDHDSHDMGDMDHDAEETDHDMENMDHDSEETDHDMEDMDHDSDSDSGN